MTPPSTPDRPQEASTPNTPASATGAPSSGSTSSEVESSTPPTPEPASPTLPSKPGATKPAAVSPGANSTGVETKVEQGEITTTPDGAKATATFPEGKPKPQNQGQDQKSAPAGTKTQTEPAKPGTQGEKANKKDGETAKKADGSEKSSEKITPKVVSLPQENQEDVFHKLFQWLKPPKRRLSPLERTIYRDISKPPRGRVSTFALMIVMACLFSVSAMVLLYVPEANTMGTWALNGFVSETGQPYVIQGALAVAIGAVFGPILGTLCILGVVVAAATGLPIFLNGSGLDAILQSPTVGYILGLPISAWAAGILTCKAFRRSPLAEWKILAAMGGCVLAMALLHALGAAGLAVHSLVFNWPADWLESAIAQWTLYPLPYDLILAAIIGALVRPIRSLFWLVIY